LGNLAHFMHKRTTLFIISRGLKPEQGVEPWSLILTTANSRCFWVRGRPAGFWFNYDDDEDDVDNDVVVVLLQTLPTVAVVERRWSHGVVLGHHQLTYQ